MPDTRHSPRHLLAAAGAIALLLSGVYIAGQGGLAPVFPPALAGAVSILLDALPTLLVMWLAAAGLGWPIRKWLAPAVRYRPAVQLATGLATLLILDWLLALAGLLNGWTAWGLCLLGFAGIIWRMSGPERRAALQPDNWPSPPWTFLLGLPVLGLLAVAATCPPGTLWAVEAFGYDVTSYHLQLPREWLDNGRMTGLHHNVYSHLPNLVEAGYMHIGAMRGSMYAGIYTAQLFHASTMLLAAICLACAVAQRCGSAAATLGGVTLLAVPWTIITGSLAYDEGVVLALGAAALLVAFDDAGRTWRGAALIGFLCGAATLAKLTAGPMVAGPLLLIVAFRLNQAAEDAPPPAGRVAWRNAVVMLLALVVTLSPYLIRNAAWTGNPVFPMAANMLGRGHWTEEQVQRWNRAHHAGDWDDVPTLLGRHWLTSAGYGAIRGVPRDKESGKITEVARFPKESGIPVLWLAVAFGVGMSATSARHGPAAAAMLVMLMTQIGFWIFGTHHQSRFLVPTLLPACVLVALGFSRIELLLRQRPAWLRPVAALAVVAPLTVVSFSTFFTQTRLIDGQHQPPWQIVDSLPRANDVNALASLHPLNQLPSSSKTLMVADAGNLIYILRPFEYAGAFDRCRLDSLRERGITHVWVNWSELNRLMSTYGFDPEVTPESVTQMARAGGWRVVINQPGLVTLFTLPRR